MSTLLSKANESTEPEIGFTGVDVDQTEAQAVQHQTEAVNEETEEIASNASDVEEVKKPSLMTPMSEEDMSFMIDQMVDRITPVIQACCITDRLEKAEQNAEEWKSMANLFIKNPQFAARKLSIGQPDVKPSMLGKHPIEQPWEIFLQTPLAAPIWTLIIKLDLHPTSSLFTRWWKKVKSDSRNDMWTKLSKYLQAIRYFNNASDSFWRKFATNPTYFSIQKICTELVTQSNWLKASGLDMPKTFDRFVSTATEIATSSGKVGDIEKILVNQWPASFRPHKLHYENEPFSETVLFAQEDENLCVNTAVLKGFEFTHTEFRKKTPSSSDPAELTTNTEEKATGKKPKLSEVSKMIEAILQST